MPRILQIDTATPVCSVALAIDGKTVALKEESGQNLHASNLTLFIQAVAATAALELKDLDAIAVSKGPGSYTGLRIGVSTVKGLCYALDKPLIAIDTLTMMAEGFMQQNPAHQGLICPMIDARRMEVFTAVFDHNLQILVPIHAKIIDEASFSDLLIRNTIAFIGDGSDKCSESIVHPNARFSKENYNSARNLSRLADEAFANNTFEDVAYFEPFYLKDFVVTQPKKKI